MQVGSLSLEEEPSECWAGSLEVGKRHTNNVGIMVPVHECAEMKALNFAFQLDLGLRGVVDGSQTEAPHYALWVEFTTFVRKELLCGPTLCLNEKLHY